jgi:hypothetical protein
VPAFLLLPTLFALIARISTWRDIRYDWRQICSRDPELADP